MENQETDTGSSYKFRKMHILIVEDEPVHARFLTNKLNGILGDAIGSITHKKSISSSIEFLQKNTTDLLFLDLNLYGENGFDVLKQFPTTSVITIIVSANINNALEAFEYGVLDFIPKPVEDDRLQQALNRFFIFHDRYRNKIKKYLFLGNPDEQVMSELYVRRYAKSRLQNVDIDEVEKQLQMLMEDEKIFKDENLSLEKLAEKIGIHSRQLSEYLNGQKETSYVAFIQKYRIQEAKNMLLADLKMNVSDIGFEVGYKSLSSFYEAFKAETGMRAGEFREQHISGNQS